MTAIDAYLKNLLRNVRILRERARISSQELEDRLVLGPGWITRFENGETLPSLDMLIAILREIGSSLDILVSDLRDTGEVASIPRSIRAEQAGDDIELIFLTHTSTRDIHSRMLQLMSLKTSSGLFVTDWHGSQTLVTIRRRPLRLTP